MQTKLKVFKLRNININNFVFKKKTKEKLQLNLKNLSVNVCDYRSVTGEVRKWMNVSTISVLNVYKMQKCYITTH